MPKTTLSFYRGGRNTSPWPQDFRKYLIDRSDKGKDCEVYLKDDSLWVKGNPLRGVSLFAVLGTISNP